MTIETVSVTILSIVIALIPPITVASAIAWLYLYRVYKHDPRPAGSWLLKMLHRAALMILLPSAWFAVLTLYRFININLPTWTRPFSGIAIVVLMVVPLYMAYTVRKMRRRRIPPPPPFDHND